MSLRPRHKPARARAAAPQSGFTLLEVMIATMIMAIGVVAALQAFTGSMRLAGNSSMQTKATVLARSLLDEQFWRTDLPEDDQFSGSEGQFEYNVEIYTADRQLLSLMESDQGLGFVTEEGGYELRHIIAEVRWYLGGIEKRVVLQTAKLAEPAQ